MLQMTCRERRGFIFVAVLLCTLYSCTCGVIAADVPTPFDVVAKQPVIGPKIVAPDTAPIGTMVHVEAAVPEDAKLAWAIDPPTTNFVVDTNGRLAYLTGPVSRRYLIVLSVAYGDKIHALTHPVILGDDPGPGPIPPGPDPIPPGQKYQVMFFQESNDLDNYNRDQVIMVASDKFKDDVDNAGHAFLRALDLNSITSPTTICVDDVCKPLDDDLQPWYRAAKTFKDKGNKTPFMGYSPREGGKDIKIIPMPKSLDEFWKEIGGKP